MQSYNLSDFHHVEDWNMVFNGTVRWRPERLMTSEESRQRQQSVELCCVLKWGANSHLQRQDRPPTSPQFLSLSVSLHINTRRQWYTNPPTHARAHHHNTKRRRDCATLTDFRATQMTRMFMEQHFICVHLLIDSFLIFITPLPQICTLFWSVIALPGSFYPNCEFKALIFIVVLGKTICLTFALSDVWNSFLLTFLITRDVYV